MIFNNYSSSPKATWAIDSEAMRARGIIVLVKSNQLVKNIETKQLQLAKRDSAAIVLVFKAGAFRCQWAITYSLVVAQPIRMQIDNRPLVLLKRDISLEAQQQLDMLQLTAYLRYVLFFLFFNFTSIHYHTQKEKKNNNYLRKKINYKRYMMGYFGYENLIILTDSDYPSLT